MRRASFSSARRVAAVVICLALAFALYARASFAQPPPAPQGAPDTAGAATASSAPEEDAAAPLADAGGSPVAVAEAGAPPTTGAPGDGGPPPTVGAPPEAAHGGAPSDLVPDVDVRQQKSRPLDAKMSFRPGKGLSLSSADGQFEMNMRIRGQILGTFEQVHAGGGETLVGAQIRRARFAMQGHMFGKHNKYKFELAVSPRDAAMRNSPPGTVGTAPLLDWFMTFDYLKAATIVAGQYKLPFSRQRVVSSVALQMVDRSIVQNEFNLDRSVGLDVRSTSLLDGHLHYFAGVYGSEGRNAFELRDNNVVYLARVDVLPFGAFDDYVEADFERTGPRLSLAGAYAHTDNSPRNQGALGRAPADRGTTTFDTAEADVLLKMYGLSATAEFFWREGDRKAGGAVDAGGVLIAVERPRDGWGWFSQLGYLLPRTMFELEGRYGMLRASSSQKSSLQSRQELGGGASYYFARHSFKLQADYFRLWTSDKLSDGVDQVRLQIETGF